MNDLSHVRAWVFDMDDTLYPREQGLMRLVQARINAFVVEAVGLAPEEAAVMQRQFLDEHGTTLAGLMANYAVDTERFLREVHDVPLDSVEPNPRLAERLKVLPGQCFVFTNGARDYAHRVLDRIGISDCFAGVFAIEDGDLTPKPNPADLPADAGAVRHSAPPGRLLRGYAQEPGTGQGAGHGHHPDRRRPWQTHRAAHRPRRA